MEMEFELPVKWGEEEMLIPGFLRKFGYQHQIVFQIEGQDYVFERDEERQFRVIHQGEGEPLDRGLLQAIVTALNHHARA